MKGPGGKDVTHNHESTTPRTIGIWGNYFAGNFGDDLMAVMLARWLEAQGLSPLIYRLDAGIAERYRIPATSDLREFLGASSRVVLGGGGYLTHHRFLRRLRQRIWRLVGTDTEREIQALLMLTREHAPRVAAISVGGDGDPAIPLTGWRRRLWTDLSFSPVTVRLPSDTVRLGALSYAAESHPDMVLAARDVLSLPGKATRRKDTFRIGFNVRRRHSKNLLRQLDNIRRQEPRVEFVEFDNHLPGYVKQYGLRGEAAVGLKHLPYRGPLELLDELADMDLVVSANLHVGVAALSLGVPFISYNGPPKARAFLRNSNPGSAGWVYGEASAEAFGRAVLELVNDDSGAISWELLNAVAPLIAMSHGHFAALQPFVTSDARAQEIRV